MKQLKLENSEVTISLDDNDYLWASQYEWFMKSHSANFIVETDRSDGQNISLMREIAKKSMGSDFIDHHCTLKLLMPHRAFDFRRRNILVVKRYKLVSLETDKINE